jgi:DNA-binding NarL/FixJ family response regulator/tetratricopeptide (TPR) repeat protein
VRDVRAMSDVLERAREAFAQESWGEACTRFGMADEGEPLAVDDLERWALAAQLVGQDELAQSTWERAHLQLLDRGELERAVRCAFWLAFGLLNRGRMAQAGGWMGRAQRLVEEHALECVEQGFLLVPVALRTLESGDPQRAHELFGQVLSFGQRFGEPDLVALGRLGQGRSLVVMGLDAEGLALLDEAMVSVAAEEVSPLVAGRIYCAVILVCQQAFDVHRAHEWTAALSAWCAAHPDLVPFRGQCLVHRSEVMQWHGDWAEAMEEAQRACERLSDPEGQPAVGLAFYQLGELHRLRGEFADAEAAYREASRHGREPQPGLSRLRLMQGGADAAGAVIRRVLKEPSDRATRARLLSASVEIMLAVGDEEAAAGAATELAEIAEAVGAPVLHAMSLHAAGSLSLHRGDARAALDHAHQAASAWAGLETPYEHATSRLLVALACRDLGDRDSAQLESDAARQAFEQLGAAPDVDRLDELFPLSGSASTGILTARQVEVLALVAAGKVNREIADALVVSEHTVRRHLQNIFHKIGVSSRAAATAYAYDHDLI